MLLRKRKQSVSRIALKPSVMPVYAFSAIWMESSPPPKQSQSQHPRCPSRIWNSIVMKSCMQPALSHRRSTVVPSPFNTSAPSFNRSYPRSVDGNATQKNSYIAPRKGAHLVDCLFDFSKKHPEPRNHFQVLVEALPQGEWHFVRLLWLARSLFSASPLSFSSLSSSFLVTPFILYRLFPPSSPAASFGAPGAIRHFIASRQLMGSGRHFRKRRHAHRHDSRHFAR
jgi:hypothetical protein